MKTQNVRNVIAAVGLALAVASPASFAGHKDRYGPSTEREWAQVVEARPIYREVRTSHPRRECWEERVTRVEHHGRDHTGATLLGGVIGGVIGHQVGGSRRHREAATVAGSLIGMAIGHDNSRQRSGNRSTRSSGWEQQCQTVEDVEYENRLDGYDVTYRFAGRLYHTRMPYDPGKKMPINVQVRPASR